MKRTNKHSGAKQSGAGEVRTLCHAGEEIIFCFARKRVKNLNVRVRADGTLAVSAPLLTPYSEVEGFLLGCLPRLLPAMKKISEIRERPPFSLTDGALIPLFGISHILVFQLGEQLSVTFGDRSITVTRRPSDGEEEIRSALAHAFSEMAKKEINMICQRIYDAFYKDSVSYPEIRYRKMVASWGNCRKSERVITLNLRLIYAPRSSVEYVVVHEFAHLIHADHSPAFWRAVSARLPDYRTRREALRAVSLRDDPVL